MSSIDGSTMLLIAMVALTITGAATAIAGLLTAAAAMIASMRRPLRPAGRHCGRPPGPPGPPPDALLRKTLVEVPTKPLELP